MRRTALCIGLAVFLLACPKSEPGPLPGTPTPPAFDPVAEAAAQAEAEARVAAAAEAEKKKQEVNDLLAQAQGVASKKDMRPALRLYVQACALGSQTACEMAGLQYHLGKAHVPKDLNKAADFYSSACDADVEPACQNLGVIYANDDGRRRPDFQLAFGYLSKACKLGNEDSCRGATQVRWFLAIDAATIWRAYHNNEVAADNLYTSPEPSIRFGRTLPTTWFSN